MLYAIALVVGLCIGAVGVGGVLLIPALQWTAGLPVHDAMATALFTFVFTGIVGSWLFQRRGSIDWSIAAALAIGAIPSGVIGAWTNARLDARPLGLMLAAVILFAGAWIFAGGRGARPMPFADRPRLRRATLYGIGVVTGFGSGLTGVGGPALAVPLLVLFGVPSLAAVGASQVVQIVAALSGSAGFIAQDRIRWSVAAALLVFELAGVVLGVVIAHRVPAAVLRGAVGVLCVAVGSVLLWRGLAGT